MSYTALPERSEAFCSYCGFRPGDDWREHTHGVCGRCLEGVFLRSRPQMAPHEDDPFLIVDGALAVQTISRVAASLLLVDRDAGCGVQMRDFLVPDDGADGLKLQGLIESATAGSPLCGTVKLHTVRLPSLHFRARVGSCGLPSAALVVLARLREQPDAAGTCGAVRRC